MLSITEYRRRAAEHRALAATVEGPERERLLEMAGGWDSLADLLAKHPYLAADDEAH